MSEKEGNKYMDDIDTDFHKVLGLEEMRAAKHATLSREELEAHMHADHRIAASTEMDPFDGSFVVKNLNTMNESSLRREHGRFHELAEQGR